jgi:hypothetical protein
MEMEDENECNIVCVLASIYFWPRLWWQKIFAGVDTSVPFRARCSFGPFSTVLNHQNIYT